jgi:hypothetical protein
MTILLSSLIYQNANIGWPLVAPTYLCKTCTTFFRLVIFRGGKYKIKFFKRIFEPTEKFAPCLIKKKLASGGVAQWTSHLPQEHKTRV